MQEQNTRNVVVLNEVSKRTLQIYIRSSLTILTGNWNWDFYTDAVFCSDVIISLPQHFDGTRAIIYPDDLHIIENELQNKEKISFVEFRIITTYGEVKIIRGENISISIPLVEIQEMTEVLIQQATAELYWKKDYQQLHLLKEIYEKAERYTGMGVWWYNTQTNETWYSNQVYRIYDLPPQSLNAHRNTFAGFIHPEDKDFVIEFTDKSFKKKIPINIEFRIKTSSGVKYISYTTHWLYSSSGEVILSGIIQDITEQKQFDHKLETIENSSEFYNQQLLFDEKNVNLGHWQVNLVTRKSYYSDHFYRIFGLKPQSIPSSLNSFINYIHPEDREAVLIANKKMLYEHKVPEIDYRIIRSDGKLRHIVQRGKLVSFGNNELLMSGTIQDVTVQKILEKKVHELNENLLVQNFTQRQAEEIAGIGSWVWNLKTGKIKWSESFHNLLGLKPNTVELSQQRLLLFIHPGDQKKFKDELAIALDQKMESNFEFRFVIRGQDRHMKASFRLLLNEGEDVFVAIFQDISEQYILQHDLYQRMQTAEALSENVLDRVIITDLSNNIIAWNKQCEAIYAIKKEDAIGHNFFDVFPHLKTEEELQLFNKVLKGETIHNTEVKALATGGYFNLHMMPLWNEEETEVTGIIHIIHDVTKETQLKKTLNDRLGFIENLVESSVDRIIAMDRDLNYMVWNKKCEEYYGLRKDQVIGKNVLEVFPDTQNTPSYEQFRKVLNGQTIHIPAAKENGVENYHEVYLIPVKNKNEEITAILWILHDLSKEYAAEKKFEHQSNVLQAVFDASLNGIILFRAVREKEETVDFEIVLNNQTTQEWTGKNLVGKHYAKEFPGIRGLGIIEEYDKLLKTGKVVRKELSYDMGDSVQWYYVTAVKLNDDELVATAVNITSTKKADEEIKNQKELLQQTTSATPDAITIYDLVGQQPIYLNTCLGDWLGYDSEVLVAMGYTGRLNLFHPDDIKKIEEFNQNMSKNNHEKISTIEYRLKTKTGKTIWIRNRSRVFKRNPDGSVTHILTVLQDITEIKNQKDELVHLNKTLAVKNKELERKNEEITNFAFVASHDLKEPLRKINTFTDWLLTREKHTLSPNGKEYLKKLSASAKRIDILIRDIVDLTRVHADHSKDELVNLNAVADNLLSSLYENIKESGAEIEIEELPVIKGNSNQLHTLLRNLLINAIKFQATGNVPLIRIHSQVIPSNEIPDIQTSDHTEYFRISITDNGIGIDKMYSKKIFMIFQRLHAQHEYEGTGMGLAICKKIMENHGGYITVDSEPGAGSSFSCYFPKN